MTRKINHKRMSLLASLFVTGAFLLTLVVGALFGSKEADAQSAYDYEYAFNNGASMAIVTQVRESGSAKSFDCGNYSTSEMVAGVNEVLHQYGQNLDYQLGENSYSYHLGNKIELLNDGMQEALVAAVEDGDKYQAMYNELVEETANACTKHTLLTYIEKHYTLNENVSFRSFVTTHEARAEDMARFIANVCNKKGLQAKYNKNGVWIDGGSYIPLNEIFD